MSLHESGRDEHEDISQMLETLLTGAKPEEVDLPVEPTQGSEPGECSSALMSGDTETAAAKAEELDVSELISWVSGDVNRTAEESGEAGVATTQREMKNDPEQPSTSGAEAATDDGSGVAVTSTRGLISEGSGKILEDVQAKLDDGGMEFVLAHISSTN
ncbi:hypothetical protein CLOM_g14539 [Closterium sp. NIES-68]|nr:hypothetical protein CLOM_g14539 [Closterium sp. NIES-68]